MPRKKKPAPKKKRSTERRKPSSSRRNSNHRKSKNFDQKNKKPEKITSFLAKVDKHFKGFAFLIPQSGHYEDLQIPKEVACDYFHGDIVRVRFLELSGEVLGIQLVEHRLSKVICQFRKELYPGAHKGGSGVFQKKNALEWIYIPQPPQGVKNNDWLLVELEFKKSGKFPVIGQVIKHLGKTIPASVDLEWLSNEHGIKEGHSEEAIKQAQNLTINIDEEMPERKDLRHLNWVTIDGEDARDFDDAIYVEKKNGHYILWVGIADVSHFVRPGSFIDQEAYEKGTSVYFPERAFHMLPSNLSENLCSLRPNEDRYAIVAQIEINSQGKFINTQVYNAIIQSKKRWIYEELQKEYELKTSDKNWEFSDAFALFETLRNKRKSRGSIDFDLPESKVYVDENGEPTHIELRERVETHRLIEEFMIAANEAVSEWVIQKSWPFIFRIHEPPSDQSLFQFQDLCRSLGISIDLEEAAEKPEVISKALKEFEGHPAESLLNQMILRAMKQAKYSGNHIGHYGLASQAYTHFTSPIRRYPDLIVHRIIKWILGVHKPAPHFEELADFIEKAAEHTSQQERIAADAERDSKKIKTVRLLETKVGQEFDGKISGLHEKGIFVQLHDPFAEGMIPKSSLKGDSYRFDDKKMTISGRRNQDVFQMGDEVRILVVSTDLLKRQVEFELIEKKS